MDLDWLAGEKPLRRGGEEEPPQLHVRVGPLPWRQVPAGGVTRGTAHRRVQARTVKAVDASRLDFTHARRAIKVTRWRKATGNGKVSREAVTSLINADDSAQDLAWLACELRSGLKTSRSLSTEQHHQSRALRH